MQHYIFKKKNVKSETAFKNNENILLTPNIWMAVYQIIILFKYPVNIFSKH